MENNEKTKGENSNPFSVEEIKNFVDAFQAGKYNMFAYIVVNKFFESLTKEERKNWFGITLDGFEKTVKIHFKNPPLGIEHPIFAAKIAAELYVTLQKTADKGTFKIPPKNINAS